MKAAYYESRGGVEALRYGERPDPAPGPGEALVALRAAGLNHIDLWVREGSIAPDLPLPHVPGCEGAGTLVALGPPAPAPAPDLVDSSGAAWDPVPGDRVLVSPGIPCGVCFACREGQDGFCRSMKTVGVHRSGTFAERIAVPVGCLVPLPESRLSPVEWAALPLATTTAWHMLTTRARLAKGETVLVLGASSGVGSAAIQVAKHFGARVFAAAGSPAKCEKAEGLGAERCFSYREADPVEAVLAETEGRGVDVVVDPIGGETWVRAADALAPRGRLVFCAMTAGRNVEIDIRKLYTRQITLLGSYLGSRAELREVVRLAGQGALTPIVDSVRDLPLAKDAMAIMEARSHFGKIVVRMATS